MKISQFFPHILFKKTIAAVLVMMILISQTIHVNFFDIATATPENYRDVVSLVVDTETYTIERSRILRYAKDIAGYLGGVRTSILVVDKNTPVATIAQKNEKLYYEGDGEKGTSALVGTILIGNIPLPQVEKEGQKFPSLFPYVDFDDKVFLYDALSRQYVYNTRDPKTEQVDIWHGVINPAVSRSWSGTTDIPKIGQFLDKTHDFYTKSGKFTPSSIPPRVFYYDQYLEQKSLDYTQIPAYALFIKNAEEIVYNRFTKHFLGYIVSELNSLKKNDQSDTEKDILAAAGVDPETQNSVFPLAQIGKMPDIQTRIPAMQLMKQFYELINKKTLGDIRAAVHNAGRYNSGITVAVDQPTLLITMADQIAMNIIKASNDKFETYIDEVEVGYEKNAGAIGAMPPFDSTTINDPIDRISRTYAAYIFGKPVSEMDNIAQCSIARGSDSTDGPYKQGILVEANQAFNGYSTADNVKNFERDGNKRVNCAPSGIDGLKIDTYWGKNIMTNMDIENWVFKQPSWIGGYYDNIFSLGGMNEVNTATGATRLYHIPGGSNTSTIVPLASNSCYALGLAYMLQAPRGKNGGEPWPKKESGEAAGDPAITCLTKQEEHSHASWEGKNVPYAGRYPPHEFDWIASSTGPGDDPQSFAPALAGPKGICEFGQIAIYIAPTSYFSGATVNPRSSDFVYACLPSAGEKCALQPGELISEKCLPKNLNQYIDTLVQGGGASTACPSANPKPNILYKTACGILGDEKHGAAEGGNFRNKYEQDIPGGWGGMFNSPCAALAAVQKENGGVVQTNTAINLCIAVEDPTITEEYSGLKKDLTTYETAVFKDIKDSRVYHKSPTNEEIDAAQSANATPSLAIDHDRYISFAHSVGGEYKIEYPNFFRFDLEKLLIQYQVRIATDLMTVRGKERIRQYGTGAATALTAYRLELDRLGKAAWAGIPLSGGALLTANPPNPACWGGQFSDAPICNPSTPGYRTPEELLNGPLTDAEIYEVIRSRNWLHPDINGKYNTIVSAALSYSGGDTSNISISSQTSACDLSRYIGFTGSTQTGAISDTHCISEPPRFQKSKDGYEIAYLGLTPYDGVDVAWNGDESAIASDYATGLNEIEGVNITEEGTHDALSSENKITNPATECGPPDGVPLLQWPSAIMCWIKAQFPPKILAGSCGPTTIGISSGFSSVSALPIIPVSSSISNNIVGLQAFYTGSSLVAVMPRSSIVLNDSITIDLTLQKGDTLLSTLPGSRAYLQIVSGTTQGKKIESSDLGKYLTITPSEMQVGEKSTNFIINSLGKTADVQLQGYYLIPLPDGTELRIDTAAFLIRITPEYYDLQLEQSGAIVPDIDTTASDPVKLRIQKILQDSTRTPYTNFISIRIIDDVSGNIVYSSSKFNPSTDTIPTVITKRTGVYRVVVYDSAGISGEITFSVRSGALTQLRITPISSALVKGERTLAMVRFLDRLGNAITPELHSLDIEVTGGYIVDAVGLKKTKMTIDVMESQVPIIIGSDAPGTLHINATIDKVLTTVTDITIHSTARIVLMRDTIPRVGGNQVPTHIEVQDASGTRITGLSAVASITLPAGAGSFSKTAITITDGISERFNYIPGTISGDHSISIDIPGIGSVSDIVFSLLPGDPMYINHIKGENNISFFLRDRYGNISNANLAGTLVRNSELSKAINFISGLYNLPLQSGYFKLEVPGIKNNTIVYSDDAGSHTIKGISRYIAYIVDGTKKIQFSPDYNARYTVLAGGDFIREGEQILYDTTPGQSQSLAVTTELDSPYKKDILFSLFPDGSYRLGQSSDTAIQTSISLSNNVPLLTVSDLTSHKHIARVLYTMKNALFDICQKTKIINCETNLTKPTIRILLPVDSSLKTDNTDSAINLKSGSISIVSIDTNGGIHMGNDIQLIPDDRSTQGLSMRIVQSGRDIASLIYVTDSTQSIALKEGESPNTPILLNSVFSLSRVPISSENNMVYGYQVIRESRGHDLDDNKNGPSHTDSLGSLSEVPGVGWLSHNTMLLSYAAGDTVGESTRFFHTYTTINMGDPVAHVDHGRPGTEIDGIDRTIGSIVERGTRSGIANFAHRDMDADGIEDLIVIYQDGYIELLLNRGGKFRSRGMVAYNRDIDAQNIIFADFTHDGYGDIVGLDKQGSLVLIDNSNRKFARKNMVLEGGAPLPNHISQFRIHDMDADGNDDIVYITASGELAILYGTKTAGNFIKKILDPTLGITLSSVPVNVGGAIRTSTTPQFQGPIGVSPVTSSGTDDSMLKGEVFYQYSDPNLTASSSNTSIETLSGVLTNISNGTTGSRISTFIRSQYAKAYGLNIEKVYTNTTHATLYPEDHITATIRIENTSSQTMRGVEYLDTIPKIFSTKDTKQYSIRRSSVSISREYDAIGDNEYDAHFALGDISPGETIEIIYEMVALPASYGEMIVGDLEQGMVGSDPYGDVGFKTSTTCGASMLLWLSGPNSRDYTKGTHEFGSANFPDGMSSRLTDVNKDSVPDSITNRSREDLIKDKETLFNSNKIGYSGPVLDTKNNQGSANMELDDNFVNNLSQTAEDIANGLACGFGGGGCMNFPMNWAPLAPGSDPVLFGNPIGDGLKVDEGLPIFSALTAINIPTPGGCYQMPVVWPASPIQFTGICNATSGAGGYLGVNSPTNFLRIFVTPTLTLGMGTAICMGGPASLMGKIPPSGLSPLIQGGNCIVVTKPMNVCKGDGSASDGDVSAVSGLGGVGGDSWNAASCHPQANTTTEADNRILTDSIVGYLKNPNPNQLTGIYSNMSRRGPRSSNVGPLLTIGGATSGGSEASIEIDSNTKISDIGSVIKVKNKRIAAFPDFLMDWLTRQTEEITTSLFTPPSLTIIPPTSFGQNAQVDSSYADFSEKLGKSYSNASFDNLKQGGVAAFEAKGEGVPGTLNAMKSAYSFIGKLPFVSIKQVNIPLNIPWFDKGELDKYARKLDGYQKEMDNAMKNFCINDPSPSCLDRKAKFQNGAFMSSIGQNLKRIEEYKKLPLKIQKYITWKERYIAQILCNIDTVQQVTGGWLRDNGIRFRKWAELFVLIKAIAESWQPMLDIFADTNASCGVCRNERNNLQYWKFKLISMLIPSIPVIKFPKWPDIILDLSDIRLGINISMPNFIPRLSPIRFPSLPSLSAGSLSLSLTIPGIPILPPIPPLPDLPDLPSLPRVKLPDLPPPPKIPKIAGSISAFLSILKLVAKMYCYYQKTILIPEWQAGDVIAQRTERQGTSPFDFINLSLPQYSLPSLREIRVASHVNYELRSDFIAEFARSAVRPINEFQTDLQSAIPSSIGTNVAIPSVHIDARPGAYIDTHSGETLPNRVAKMVENIDRDKNIFLEIVDFAKLLETEIDAPELSQVQTHLQRGLRVAELESQELQDKLVQYNNTKFSLLRDYLARENDSNAELQNIIDLISHDRVGEPRQLIADMISGSTRSTGLLARLNQFETQYTQESIVPVSVSVGLDQIRDSLSERISRMTSATTTSNQALPSTDYTSTPTGYSPNYQGIYIKTPTGVQTRLFDYIDPVTPSTRVATIDIDRDGDLDYIYLLDGILYVKYSWSKIPNKIIDTTTKISGVSQRDIAPYVPDYFYEDISTPRNLNYSFVSSSQTETEWRVDFYDQYTEWDKIDIGLHDPRVSPKTSIDMFLDTSPIPLVSDTGILTHVVSRSLSSVVDPDSFALEGRRIDIYTGSVSLSLSPGRVLYTGDRSVTISYKNEKNPIPKSQILSPHTGYEFSTPTEISTNGGQLYLIGAKDNSRYVYSDELIGIPILSDMRLYGSDAGSVIRDATHDRDISLSAGTTYITYGLGTRSDHYNISLPYADGYYYARLQNLTDKKLDRAGVTLLSPQAASDDGDPVIDLPTEIRLPIYTARSYPLSDVLTDFSAVTLMIDSDITTDSNNNSVFDDDFMAKSSTVAISSSDITFGSFTQPGRYNMMLKAVDVLGNTTTMPLVVTAYTPLPQIQSVTSTGWVLGTISESLGGIPTHLFRVRSGEQPTLLASGSVLSDILGRFSTGSFFVSPETIALKNISQIGTITTRGLVVLQSGYHTEIAPASSTDPMRILTVDQTGSISHIHTISLPTSTQFIDTSRTIASATGVLLTPTTGVTRIAPASQTDTSIPGGQYITDTSYRPLAAIARDGNIYTIDPLVTLRYRPQNGYMSIELIRSGNILASIAYHIDFFYTMR